MEKSILQRYGLEEARCARGRGIDAIQRTRQSVHHMPERAIAIRLIESAVQSVYVISGCMVNEEPTLRQGFTLLVYLGPPDHLVLAKVRTPWNGLYRIARFDVDGSTLFIRVEPQSFVWLDHLEGLYIQREGETRTDLHAPAPIGLRWITQPIGEHTKNIRVRVCLDRRNGQIAFDHHGNRLTLLDLECLRVNGGHRLVSVHIQRWLV